MSVLLDSLLIYRNGTEKNALEYEKNFLIVSKHNSFFYKILTARVEDTNRSRQGS